MNENPITRLTAKMERAERDVARLDAWTRDKANEDSCDWDYRYNEFRKAQARVKRCHMAILRMDVATYGDTCGYAAAAMASIKGQLTYYRPTPALAAFKRRAR